MGEKRGNSYIKEHQIRTSSINSLERQTEQKIESTTKNHLKSKMIFTAILVLLSLGALLPVPTASQLADNTALPLSLPPRVLTGTEQTCPPDALRQTSLAGTAQDIRTLIRGNIICPATTGTQTNPAASCSSISTNCPDKPSGNYWVRSSSGSAVQVYCDLERVCGCSGDSTGGWARIAYLDTTDTSQQCPSAWRLITTPRRTCGRSTNAASCESAIFQSNGIQYSHICGRVIGYQHLSPDAFEHSTNIDSHYLDGVSITHGVPGSRQHIWSFAAAWDSDACPCHSSNGSPSFVGQDYFCETGNDNDAAWDGMFVTDDPLWDGQDCGTSNTCECTLNNPPWFCKQLPQATTDDIEVRICGNQDLSDEDTPVELIELYVR